MHHVLSCQRFTHQDDSVSVQHEEMLAKLTIPHSPGLPATQPTESIARCPHAPLFCSPAPLLCSVMQAVLRTPPHLRPTPARSEEYVYAIAWPAYHRLIEKNQAALLAALLVVLLSAFESPERHIQSVRLNSRKMRR